MTGRLADNGRILRHAVVSAMADLRATYSWKSWAFGWLMRIFFQVTLFAMVGRLVGSAATVEYLVIGNAVFVTADVVMLVCASTSWERLAGTLPLLVASPASPFVVFAGRSVQWLLDGVTCSAISLALLAPVLGVVIPFPAVLLAIPLLVLIALSVYCFGLVLGGFALRVMQARNLVGRLGSLLLMLVTGVQVPVSFWPAPVRHVAEALPLTHGLQAVRGLLDGAAGVHVLRNAAAEGTVAVGWLIVAAVVYRRLVSTGRQDGSIEFGG